MLNQTLYANIDDILGDHCKRFFSSGYKFVKHKITDIQVNPSIHRTSAKASIYYPADWSKKEGTDELKPHLSTLDGLILSIHLNTIYLNSIFNLNELQKNHTWIRKVHMKSGANALFDLENMRITTHLVKTETTTDSLCGHLSTFVTQIENMSVEMVLDHYIGEYDSTSKRYEKIEDVFEKIGTSYYGSYYRECKRDLFDLQVDLDNQTLSAWVKISYPNRTEISDGISSMYYPFYTPLDTFVCSAQQIQALFYLIDGVERNESNNLWMREVNYESKQPIYRPSGFKQTVVINKSKILKRGQNRWRIADFGCHLDAFPELFKLNVSVAHELPQSKG